MRGDGMGAGPTASIPITRPHLPPMERFSEDVADLFASRLLSNFAKYAGLLESRAAAVLDHPAPLCVSSCDIGLTLAWRALGCSAGEVIVPSFTFCSTVNALMWNGLEPVFADVDPRTYCIDVEDARGLITPRTVGIAAVHTSACPRTSSRWKPWPESTISSWSLTPPMGSVGVIVIRPWAPSATPPSSA